MKHRPFCSCTSYTKFQIKKNMVLLHLIHYIPGNASAAETESTTTVGSEEGLRWDPFTSRIFLVHRFRIWTCYHHQFPWTLRPSQSSSAKISGFPSLPFNALARPRWTRMSFTFLQKSKTSPTIDHFLPWNLKKLSKQTLASIPLVGEKWRRGINMKLKFVRDYYHDNQMILKKNKWSQKIARANAQIYVVRQNPPTSMKSQQFH